MLLIWERLTDSGHDCGIVPVSPSATTRAETTQAEPVTPLARSSSMAGALKMVESTFETKELLIDSSFTNDRKASQDGPVEDLLRLVGFIIAGSAAAFVGSHILLYDDVRQRNSRRILPENADISDLDRE
jgi:hypothetical protein